MNYHVSAKDTSIHYENRSINQKRKLEACHADEFGCWGDRRDNTFEQTKKMKSAQIPITQTKTCARDRGHVWP